MNNFEKAWSEPGDDKSVKDVDDPLDIVGRLYRIERLLDKVLADKIGVTTTTWCYPIDRSFQIEKDPNFYRVLYRGKKVWEIGGSYLKQDIYGGRTVSTDCDLYGTNEIFGFRCGWKKDLFIGFGIKKDGGRVIGLQVLYFFPHDSEMTITTSGSNEFQVLYGRNRDLRKVLCWNSFRPDAWSFSYDIRSGKWEPCSIDRQGFTNQFFIEIDGVHDEYPLED